MNQNKTRENDASVEAYIRAIPDDNRRSDCQAVLELMREISGHEPRMWGESIVGFGWYHYRSRSGREGDWFLTGFSSRKSDLSLYTMAGFDGAGDLLARLGKHKTGKGCLYIKRLSDVDPQVLRELVARSLDHMRKTYCPAE